MLKKIWLKFWPAIVITIVIFAFHSRLFFPHLSFYVTPDYGRSDAWHLSIANKFYYAQELKKNRIPIWNPQIGTGYPILAEGQTGTFFLPNIVLLRFLPFALAYNLDLVFTFILAAAGIYLFSRSLQLNKLASTYAGIIFALGGFFVVHVQHLHLIQTASLLPWLFWTVNEYLNKKKVIYLAFFSIFIAQQIFAGFPQLVVYGLFGLYLYLAIKLFLAKNALLKNLFFISVFLILGFGLAAVQILPTLELLKLSGREASAANVLNQFPYTPKNLLQFANPFILGSPKDGTYPKWVPEVWGIYWESIAYVGLLPLFLSITSIKLILKKKTKEKWILLIFLLLALVGITLALGKYSPAHPFFSIPPFNLFRVPSRFLLFTQLSLVILAATVLNKLNKKFIIAVILLVSTLDLFHYFYAYNPTDSAQKWLNPPQTASFLKQDSARILTLGQGDLWNKHFFNGWKDTSYYYFARNSLDQNSNLIFGKSQIFAYESLLSQRQSLMAQIINVGATYKDQKYNISPNTVNLLTVSNTRFIISPYEIENHDFEKIYQTDDFENTHFNLYKNKNETKRAYIANDYQIAKTISETIALASDKSFDPFVKPILEKTLDINMGNKEQNWSANVTSDKGEEVTVSANLDKDGLLVLADSYYPGWKAYDNGKEVQILASNINQKAVALKNGEHTVMFKYQPKSLEYGILISTLSLCLVIFIAFRTKIHL